MYIQLGAVWRVTPIEAITVQLKISHYARIRHNKSRIIKANFTKWGFHSELNKIATQWDVSLANCPDVQKAQIERLAAKADLAINSNPTKRFPLIAQYKNTPYLNDTYSRFKIVSNLDRAPCGLHSKFL